MFTCYFTLVAALVTSDLSVRPWILQNKNRSLSLPTTLPAYPLEVLRANNIIGFDPLYRWDVVTAHAGNASCLAAVKVLEVGLAGGWRLACRVPTHHMVHLGNCLVVCVLLCCSYGEAYYRWIADETWTFSTTFNSSDPDIAPAMASSAAQLRFYGLDTFAAVQLNGKDVLAANNFHR